MDSVAEDGPTPKRLKIAHGNVDDGGKVSDDQIAVPLESSNEDDPQSSMLNAPISPPRARRALSAAVFGQASIPAMEAHAPGEDVKPSKPDSKSIRSPIQLSYVEGLPAADNVNTVSLRDILGNPLIKECWAFNYLFDVDFLM